MSGRAGPPWPVAWDRVLVPLLGLVVFFVGLGAHELWNPDEPRYADVAREMRASGDYLVPHRNGEIYAEKPPLHFWGIAAFGALRGGVDEVAARLPSAVAALASLCLVFLFARERFGRSTAWFSAVVFATSSKILWQSHVGQIDMLLTGLVLAGVFSWMRATTMGQEVGYLLFFVFTGLATLAKGPVGLLPPLLSVLVFLVWEGRRDLVRRLRPGRGLLVWAAIVLAWFVPAALSGGQEYFETLLLKQNVTRYANPWGHHHPWHYYLTALPADFFPWLFVLPGALLAGWRSLDGEARRWARFAATWVIVTLVFFSLSPGKRNVYILTMYPGLALLTGAALDGARREAGRLGRWWLAGPLAAVGGLLVVAALAVPFAWQRVPEVEGLDPGLAMTTLLLVGGVGAASILAAWLARARRIGALVSVLGTGMAIGAACLFLVVLPKLDPVKSARPLAERLLELSAEDEPYAILPRIDEGFLFYTERHATVVHSSEELASFLTGTGRKWVLAERDDLGDLEPRPDLIEVARDPDPKEGYLLLTTPPWPRTGLEHPAE